MKNFLLLTLCLIFLPFLCYANQNNNKSKSLGIKIGYITEANTLNECGCSFYLQRDKKQRNIFSSDLEKIVWMNLDGKDVKLKLVKSTKSEKNERKDGRFYDIYKYDEMTIRIDSHVTWTCESDDPANESCEVSYYDVKITFTKNGQQKTISAKGLCGC